MSRHYRIIYIRCVIYCIITVFAIFAKLPLSAQSSHQQSSSPSIASTSYPPDPPHDIEWAAGKSTWQDIVDAFNAGRRQEGELLGRSLGSIVLPNADVWATMSGAESVLWLVNEERVARGLAPLQGLEVNVTAVAQTYAEYMLAENLFSHDADGRSPHERLTANPVLGACSDFLGISENLYLYATTGNNAPPLLLAEMIYQMIYVDAGSEWGHRHAILWTSYTENSGASDREGFLGVGIARGGYTLDGQYYQNTQMIVLNFFDPCATWVETAPVTPVPTAVPTVTPMPTVTATPSSTPISIATPTPPQFVRTISGRVVLTGQNSSGHQAQDLVESGLADVTLMIRNDEINDVIMQTDEFGSFSYENLSPGVYTLVPSKTGYTFAPSSITVNLIGGDLDNVVFSAWESNPNGNFYSYSLHLPLIRPD